jgi:ubiquinone/menaquinone biosynthesis C-methylase UbiE
MSEFSSRYAHPQKLVPGRSDVQGRDAVVESADDQDVPYGEDWHNAAEVDAWAAAADGKRPWRSRFREAIAERVAALKAGARVLELGAGPGMLAEHVLSRCPDLAGYTLLDFSGPMLALCRRRLSRFTKASFLQGDFRTDAWLEGSGGPFDCVVSMQAIHEARHKRHAPEVYRRIQRVTQAPGLVLICDHTPLDDSERSHALYMTESEQERALTDAGFVDVEVALSIRKLVLYVARKGQRAIGAGRNRAVMR